MDIHDTLGEAIALLEQAKPRAFGAGSVVDRDRLLQLLNHARTVLPEEILAAASIVAQRNSLIASAEQPGGAIRGRGTVERRTRSGPRPWRMPRPSARPRSRRRRTSIERAERERDTMIDEHLVQEQRQGAGRGPASRGPRTRRPRCGPRWTHTSMPSWPRSPSTLAKTLDTIEAGRERKVRAQADPDWTTPSPFLRSGGLSATRAPTCGWHHVVGRPGSLVPFVAYVDASTC